MRILLLLILVISGQATADERTRGFQDPLPYADYVVDPAVPIKQGMDRYGWIVDQQGENFLVAKLDNYKEREVVIRFEYGQGAIAMLAVSDQRLGCTRRNCAVEDGHYIRWTNNLRRGIALAIHEMAIADAKKKLGIEVPD